MRKHEERRGKVRKIQDCGMSSLCFRSLINSPGRMFMILGKFFSSALVYPCPPPAGPF
jgi:hypothetical protein